MSDRWRITLANGEIFEADDKLAVLIAALRVTMRNSMMVESFEVQRGPGGRWIQAIASLDEIEAARAAVEAEES
jgi:hypothetical protein